MKLWKLTCIFMTIAFLSCENETDNNQMPPPAQTPLLMKVVRIDTTLTAPLDTVESRTFYYDNLKRITEIIFSEVDASGNITPYTTMKYYYNGSDTFAYKSVELATNDTLTKHYLFASGRLVMDSSYTPGNHSYGVTHYSYLGNTVLVEGRFFHPQYGMIVTRRKANQAFDSNNNIVHQIDSATQTIPGEPIMSVRNEYVVSYLPNHNPFVKISDPIRRPYLWSDLVLGSLETSPNFLMSQTREISDYISPTTSHNEHTINYTYEFRSDGLPSVARLSTLHDDPRKLLFFYE